MFSCINSWPMDNAKKSFCQRATMETMYFRIFFRHAKASYPYAYAPQTLKATKFKGLFHPGNSWSARLRYSVVGQPYPAICGTKTALEFLGSCKSHTGCPVRSAGRSPRLPRHQALLLSLPVLQKHQVVSRASVRYVGQILYMLYACIEPNRAKSRKILQSKMEASWTISFLLNRLMFQLGLDPDFQ